MPRVLIVDDESQIRGVLAELLALEGLEVVEAEDGQAGLDMALPSAPDLMVLDIQMPRLTGLEVLQGLRTAATAAPGLPVIMLTASQDLQMSVEAMRRGAFDYIAKPFDPQDFLLHVQRALRCQALQAEADALRSELTETGPLGSSRGPARRSRT